MKIIKLIILLLGIHSAIIFADGEHCEAFTLGNNQSDCQSNCESAHCTFNYCTTVCSAAPSSNTQLLNPTNQSRVFVPPPGLRLPSTPGSRR